MAAADPDRAARLTADAEYAAQSINEEVLKARTLARIAQVLAAVDLDRAEGIARSITDGYEKALALARIAEAVTAAVKPVAYQADRSDGAEDSAPSNDG